MEVIKYYFSRKP